MLIIGIDPGTTGAVAVLEKETGEIITAFQFPTFKVGTKNRLNVALIRRNLVEALDGRQAECFQEKVGAMPSINGKSQGSVSAFTFGRATGQTEALIIGLGIPYTEITPQAWKKHCGLIGTEKDAARGRAIQLYPEFRALDTKVRGQAIADAILIARAGAGMETSRDE